MWLDTVFSITALIGGTVLAFQFVLMLLGMGNDGDLSGADGADLTAGDHFGGAAVGGDHVGGAHVGSMDVGSTDVTTDHTAWHDAAGADLGHPYAHWFYEVISLRTMSAAVTFFGLAGKTALAYRQPPMQAFVLATLVGLVAMYIVYWLFKQVYRLQQIGNENIRNAVGSPATVYVPIPANRAGHGKVTFRLQNRLVEYLAVTEGEERLKTGEKVVVIGVVNSETVKVARAEKTSDEAPAPITNTVSSV